MGTFPGSLSEGAGSPQGLTEGVSSDGCSGPMAYSPAHINSEIFERLRSSKYTPSASLRSAAPSEREPGGVRTIHRATQKPQRCGRFSSPLRNSEVFTFHHSSNDTPSVTPIRACQLPQRGSREWAAPFNVPPGSRNVTGDFHRPYETLNVLHFTIQWPTERVTKETRNQYEIS